MSEIEKNCNTCISMMQGTGCCFCANPDQKDESLRGYVYWPFSCDLWEKGTHPKTNINNFSGSENYNGFKDSDIKYNEEDENNIDEEGDI